MKNLILEIKGRFKCAVWSIIIAIISWVAWNFMPILGPAVNKEFNKLNKIIIEENNGDKNE